MTQIIQDYQMKIVTIFRTVQFQHNVVVLPSRLMRKVYVYLEILHKINLQLSYHEQQELTEFISFINNITKVFRLRKSGIFTYEYWCHVNDFIEV